MEARSTSYGKTEVGEFGGFSGMFVGHGGGMIPVKQRYRRWSRQQWCRRIGGCALTKKRTLAAGFCVLAFFAVDGCAQTVALSGVVHDSSGAVVVGAVVREQSGTWEASAKTDPTGHFSFANVPAGA